MTHRTFSPGFCLSLLGSMIALGCASAHEPTGVAPGVYELTIQTDSDVCSPMRPAGAMGPVAVLVEGTTVDVPIPESGATVLTATRVRLEAASSFHAETNRRLRGCEDAWVHEEWTVMETMDEGFDVLMRQDFQGIPSCDADVSEPVPSGDCVAERTMGFRLETACYAPCSLRLGVGGTISCGCS